MRSVIILLSVLLITWPSRVNACNGGCDEFYAVLLGTPAVLTSTIIFPLIGRADFDGENPPYRSAVGYTLVASSVGV